MSGMTARHVQAEPRFRVEIERDATGRHTVAVLQRRVRRAGEAAQIVFEPVARAGGLPLDVALPLLAQALRAHGVSPERLARASGPDEAPIDLDEATGARVALALVAVRPLRKLARMEGVVRGVGEMSPEEALYWYARAMKGPQPRVLRALRILLAKE